MTPTASLGRLFLAIGVMASGVQQLVIADFVRLVPKLPPWVPSQAEFARLMGLVLLVVGAAMLTERWARAATVTFAGLLLSSFFLLNVPRLMTNPMVGFMWTNPLKVLALVGGALLLFESAAGVGRATRWGAVLMAAFLVVGGIQHFVYADFVTQLVPEWIPRRLFWTYFAGVALIAGGVGSVVPRTARLAATLTGVMIFLWVVLLHIPRAFADLRNAGETSAIFEALALSGVAFLLAARASKGTR